MLPTRESDTPNRRWEISGGDDNYVDDNYHHNDVSHLIHGHKVHLKPADNNDNNFKIWYISGISGRFVAPQPLVQGEGLWDVSSESVVTCPQVSQFVR